MQNARQMGFTLIELSIVLVIIGLIVGGVLLGRDLIHAAEVRSVISDVERFRTAALTFQENMVACPVIVRMPRNILARRTVREIPCITEMATACWMMCSTEATRTGL